MIRIPKFAEKGWNIGWLSNDPAPDPNEGKEPYQFTLKPNAPAWAIKECAEMNQMLRACYEEGIQVI
jgi:hypothetical protein